MGKKILLVISNYNEESSILHTINDIRKNSAIPADILVIDNSSTDQSQELIKKSGVEYIFHPVNTGGSQGVIKTAFAYAYYYNYDIYCHMDGDNQHKASELIKLVKPILDNDADVVTGSRFIEKKGFQSNFFRRLGIYFSSRIIALVTHKKQTDITSGFRAYNKKAIQYFAKHFKQEIETIIQLELVMFYANLKTKDVPVLMQPRTSGKSEINFANAVKFPVYNLISFIGTVIQKYK